MNEPAVEPINETIQCRAEPRCTPCDRVEHGLHVHRRSGEYTEDLTGCCLIVERHLQLALSRLLWMKQPRVLKGDDRLVGEGLEQRDLLFTEHPDFGSADPDRADSIARADQRDRQCGAGTSASGKVATPW